MNWITIILQSVGALTIGVLLIIAIFKTYFKVSLKMKIARWQRKYETDYEKTMRLISKKTRDKPINLSREPRLRNLNSSEEEAIRKAKELL